MKPDARTAREDEELSAQDVLMERGGKPEVWVSQQEHDALLAQVERLEQERDEAHRLLNTTIPASAVLATMDASARAEAAEARAQQAERERNEAVERAKALGKVSWDATQRRQEAEARAVQAERERDEALRHSDGAYIRGHKAGQVATEARAQRYREALYFYATGDGATATARRALASDPLVCRDPNLCWATGTCPRDPACNE